MSTVRKFEDSRSAVTAEIASLIKAMIRRGDRHSDIATCFGINQGRVADVKEGRIHPEAPVASSYDLPPPGPYLTPFTIWQQRVALEGVIDKLNDAVAHLRKLEQRQARAG